MVRRSGRRESEVATTAEREFTAFVERYEPRLRAALMSAYGPERGREATCEALAFAWEHWERVSVLERPVGYLYRVGQSKSRPRKRPRPDPPTTYDHEPWFEPGLPKALEKLTRRQRMAVVLVDAYSWTQHEAAEVMGVADETLRTHLERGRRKLRASMGVSIYA
jgi:DNA-directed RNA polymerase specialized sigma24 family protein